MDSSLLIEADRRHILPILKAYLNAKQKTIAPPRVYEETVTEPRSIPSFAQSSKRIEKMYVSGTIEIQNPNYGLAEVSDIVDRVRVCIAKKSGKPLHMVEKADLQTTALVAWHATKGDSVEFIFHDRALKQVPAVGLRR